MNSFQFWPARVPEIPFVLACASCQAALVEHAAEGWGDQKEFCCPFPSLSRNPTPEAAAQHDQYAVLPLRWTAGLLPGESWLWMFSPYAPICPVCRKECPRKTFRLLWARDHCCISELLIQQSYENFSSWLLTRAFLVGIVEGHILMWLQFCLRACMFSILWCEMGHHL